MFRPGWTIRLFCLPVITAAAAIPAAPHSGSAQAMPVAIQETTPGNDTAHAELKRLEWMIGEWSQQEAGQVVRMNCHWSEDGSFLLVEFRVRESNAAERVSSERIAWDPAARKFRSWTFRNDGSFCESNWTARGNDWQVQTRGVVASGSSVSGTLFWQPRPDGKLTIRATRIRVGSEEMPDSELNLARAERDSGPLPAGGDSAIEKINWHLYEMQGVPMEFDQPLTLQLANGKLQAFGGINQIGGRYTLNGNQLDFAELESTLMGGPPERMQLESLFRQMLDSADSFALQGTELELLNGQETLARFRAGR